MMNKSFIKSGLALTALLGLCWPVASFAQVTQETTTTQFRTTPTSTTTTQTTTETPVATPAGVCPASVCLVSSAPALAGNHSADTLLLKVANPTCTQVNFTISSLGINEPIPAMSSRTFYVDKGHVPTDQLAYNVLGCNGEQVACGTVNVTPSLNETTTVALSNIINYSTAYAAPVKPEPVYNTAYREKPMEKAVSYRPLRHHYRHHRMHRRHRNMVRGYW